MDESGQGQARMESIAVVDPWETFRDAVTSSWEQGEAPLPTDAPERRGLEAMGTLGCFSTCHMPLRVNGTFPDLIDSVVTKDAKEILATLDTGRPPAMPDPALDEAQIDQVYALLSWVAAHREAVEAEVERRVSDRSVNWLEVPWWEY